MAIDQINCLRCRCIRGCADIDDAGQISMPIYCYHCRRLKVKDICRLTGETAVEDDKCICDKKRGKR